MWKIFLFLFFSLHLYQFETKTFFLLDQYLLCHLSKNNLPNNKKRVVNFKQDFINKTDIELDKKYEKHNSEKIGKKNILKNANKTITFKEEIKEENKNKKSSKNINEIKDEITDNKNDNDKSNKINQINNYNYNINIFAAKVEIPLNQINNIENKTPIKYNKEDNDEINNSSNLGRINSEISFYKDFIIDIKDDNIIMENRMKIIIFFVII
jgi:hypothetical protein